jgi:hypothetical protein
VTSPFFYGGGTVPSSCIRPDGTLDLPTLMARFARLWEHRRRLLTEGFSDDMAPQLVLMSFLRRVGSSGGLVDRGHIVGRGQVDLFLRWPYTTPRGRRRLQEEVIEVKLWRPGGPSPLWAALPRLDGYLDRLGLASGTLVVFDQQGGVPAPYEGDAVSTVTSPAGRPVTLVCV